MEDTQNVTNEVIENDTDLTENVTIEDTSVNEQLLQIHEDLGIITCFIVFFVLVILLKYVYKFFDMIFKY